MISIALATYNGAQYLDEQLNSYIDQTRKPDEIVVCDDCSTDRTLSVLKNFRKKAPFPVKINQNLTNKGTVASFANAVNGCSGDFIFFSDHDDVWLEDKIEVMMRVFERDPSIGLVFCDAEVVNENLTSLGCSFWESVWFSPKSCMKVNENKAFSVFLNHAVVAGMSSAFRADLRSVITPFPEFKDGYDGWTALLISAVRRVRAVPQKLLKYRVHSNNQFGIRKLSWYEQYLMAKDQVRNKALDNQYQFFLKTWERLKQVSNLDDFRVKAEDLKCLEEKLSHLEIRKNLPTSTIHKLLPVAKESFNGNYFKFSYGVKSMLQDFLLAK